MDTNVNYTLVGAFVIILVSFLIMSIIWLSAGFSFESYKTYQIFMQESVSGLSVDSPVEYNGVNVGNVSKIVLDKQNPHQVEILISIKKKTPISKSTVATLNTRGLTGVAYLALQDKGTDLTPLTAEEGQPYPIIKTAPSLFLRWDTALNKLSNNLAEVAKSVQNLLNEENQQAIKQILVNLNLFTKNLAAQNQKLDLILKNTAEASQEFYPMIMAGRNTMQILQTQTLPATNRIINNLDTITNNLSQVSTIIRQNPAVLIRGQGPQPLGPGEK